MKLENAVAIAWILAVLMATGSSDGNISVFQRDRERERGTETERWLKAWKNDEIDAFKRSYTLVEMHAINELDCLIFVSNLIFFFPFEMKTLALKHNSHTHERT